MFAYKFNKTLYSDKVFRRIELISLARQTSALEKMPILQKSEILDKSQHFTDHARVA